MTNKAKIGIYVKRLRHRAELSQEELAALSDVAIAFLKQIELDNKQPTVTTLFKLAAALNVTPDQLVMPCWQQWKQS